VTIGVLIPEFPSQTHIMFWREVTAIRAAGEDVAVISTKRPAADACRHSFAEAARREAHYVFPPRPAASALALAGRPVGVARALRYVAGLSGGARKGRLRCLGLLACAADLLDFSRRRRIEHIHVHSCGDAAHIAALCHALGGPPYSLTLHGDLPVYGTDHARKMARAKFVMTAGPHLLGQVTAVGVPPGRAIASSMGIDLEAFRDGGRRRLERGRLRLVTVARLNPCKGHRHALAALRAGLDAGLDLSYTIVGEGPARGDIEGEIRRLGLGANVGMVGSLGEDGVAEALRDADAFLLPSVGEGEAWPVSLMEAMASGLPVVCSIIGSTPEMVSHGVEGFLVPQRDEPALAAAIRQLAEDPERRRRMGEAARARMERGDDCHRTARRLLEAIRTL
jgi:glycosyltransferase involved in cell wall biosynthesis